MRSPIYPAIFLAGNPFPFVHPAAMSRRHLKSILCAAAALLAWAVLPGTFIDRGLFALTARAFAEPTFFITGRGIHENAHNLRTLKRQATQPADPLPDITITDDPDRVFQTSPPSPVDYAIILKNLRRMGRESIAIGMPLAWPEPDVISLMALDLQLDALASVVTAAPLSRGPIPSPLPPAFRRASVAVSEIHGNTRNLPLVNRVSIPDVMLGNTTSLAGFTALESEPESGPPHLLARWDDRVVLSFPLLAALADHEISPEKIEIRMGNFISLGKDGPFIPIDEFGRLAFSPPSSDGSTSIPAESLIDAPDDFLNERRAGTVLIRNGMSAADESSLRFSESLVPTASLLADPSGTSTSRAFTRIPRPAELLLLASLISLIHGLGYYPMTSDRRALLALAGIFLILHFILVPTTGTWLPTLPALAAVFTAIPLTARRLPVSVKAKVSQPKPTPPPAAQREAMIAANKAAKKVAKKAAKKTARKAPAKKTPRKRKGG
jgi:hypothetical protein